MCLEEGGVAGEEKGVKGRPGKRYSECLVWFRLDSRGHAQEDALGDSAASFSQEHERLFAGSGSRRDRKSREEAPRQGPDRRPAWARAEGGKPPVKAASPLSGDKCRGPRPRGQCQQGASMFASAPAGPSGSAQLGEVGFVIC